MMKQSIRKSASQWEQLIKEFAEGVESERKFCTRYGIKLATLRKWRYQFGIPRKPASAGKQSPGFFKVSLKPAPVVQLPGAVLCLGNEIRLECPEQYDINSKAQLALHHGR